jgi:phosphotransferase system  glucose/maltose/N-acetylglucosamine-specific IIC component
MSAYVSSVRKTILILLTVVTPVGFLFKFYSGPAQYWFNNYGAGVLYEIFWCLVIFVVWPQKEMITRIVVGVFSVTCFLEFLQLWHPWYLEKVRSTFLGKAVIGTTFVWWDFPHYVLGCAAAWLFMRWMARASLQHR